MVLAVADLHAAANFSALQRAEIAEIRVVDPRHTLDRDFSALQRAEIAETVRCTWT